METLRITDDACLYFLTYSVIEWLPVFVAEEPCCIITDSLNYCHRNRHLRISGFVIMPTHLHLIVFDAEFDNKRLAQTLTDMRKFTGHKLLVYSQQHLPAAFATTMQKTSRADRDNQFWQQGRHAEAIYGRDFFAEKLGYLHDNPRRKGLVWEPTQWRFSSAAYWLAEPPGSSDVILTAVEW
ncbi:MAG: hypothetical protein BWY52_01356 [Chloroflexi bacterium ADurb.Bin325]|nr:MAG: hypothetical protein BWY52_01356 [Chloroflexi bacterium ADurb.Bin325]